MIVTVLLLLLLLSYRSLLLLLILIRLLLHHNIRIRCCFDLVPRTVFFHKIASFTMQLLRRGVLLFFVIVVLVLGKGGSSFVHC